MHVKDHGMDDAAGAEDAAELAVGEQFLETMHE
jgi:hypothetical protein